jgi:hypothetical protein
MKEQVEPGVMSAPDDRALRITFDDFGKVTDFTGKNGNGSPTLTVEQEKLRTYFQSSAAFVALLDIWLRALERGEATTPKQLVMLHFAGRVLCTQHEEIASLLQKLV